jgi:hypothetical protein
LRGHLGNLGIGDRGEFCTLWEEVAGEAVGAHPRLEADRELNAPVLARGFALIGVEQLMERSISNRASMRPDRVQRYGRDDRGRLALHFPRRKAIINRTKDAGAGVNLIGQGREAPRRTRQAFAP